MQVLEQDIQIHVAGGRMGAFLAQPQAPGTYPGVIIGMEIFGVTAHIRSLTRRVAELGFVALAPDFYHRTAPGVQLERAGEGRERGLQLAHELKRPEVLADVQASLNELQRRGCPRIGMLGFSLGGHLAFLAASQLPLAATGVLYPGWLPTTTLPVSQPHATLELTPGIRGSLLFLVGEEDHAIPPDHQRQIRETLAASGVQHEFVTYPATPHGFFCEEAESFRQDAHNDAWQRIQNMLKRELA